VADIADDSALLGLLREIRSQARCGRAQQLRTNLELRADM
jgi:hypothetical protein